jgi:hypothetical protein
MEAWIAFSTADLSSVASCAEHVIKMNKEAMMNPARAAFISGAFL